MGGGARPGGMVRLGKEPPGLDRRVGSGYLGRNTPLLAVVDRR